MKTGTTPAKLVRKPISKRVRFEIFKRDLFTCQYCGRTPPTVMLEIDHIIPVAEGGGNDGINLTTSCEDCNSGKSSIPLDDKIFPSDARLEFLRIQQEKEEAKRYLLEQIELQRLQDSIHTHLHEEWARVFRQDTRRPISRASLSERQLRCWLINYKPAELVISWDIIAGCILTTDKIFHGNALFAYITGILKQRHVGDKQTDAKE